MKCLLVVAFVSLEGVFSFNAFPPEVSNIPRLQPGPRSRIVLSVLPETSAITEAASQVSIPEFGGIIGEVGGGDLATSAASAASEMAVSAASAVAEALPEMSVPEFSVPEFSVPEFTAPEFPAPKFPAPEVPAPEFPAPEFSVPEFSVPEFSVPEFSIPEFNVPKFSIPELSLPELSLPELSLPQLSLPELGGVLPEIGGADIGASAAAALSQLSEIGGVEIAIGGAVSAASAAAGVVSQRPKIAKLEQENLALETELRIAKSDLTESEQKLVSRVAELEEALFEMDREFETSSAEMKNYYDETLRAELEKLSLKLGEQFLFEKQRIQKVYEEEVKLQLDVQEGKLRQKFLEEKVKYMNEYSEKTKVEFDRIMKEQTRISVSNRQLEGALEATRKEVEAVKSLKVAKDKVWPL